LTLAPEGCEWSASLHSLFTLREGDIVNFYEVQNVSYVTELLELQNVSPVECLPIPGEKQNIILVIVVPLMLPT
jgi:hypothetical protein